jgi:hypothetical protein
MKTQFIGFEFETQVSLMVDGVQIDDADINLIIDAVISIHDTRDTGGRDNEVCVEKVETEYVAEIPEDFCLEVFGHSQNVFKVTSKQILNHPDLDSLIQEYVDEHF